MTVAWRWTFVECNGLKCCLERELNKFFTNLLVINSINYYRLPVLYQTNVLQPNIAGNRVQIPNSFCLHRSQIRVLPRTLATIMSDTPVFTNYAFELNIMSYPGWELKGMLLWTETQNIVTACFSYIVSAKVFYLLKWPIFRHFTLRKLLHWKYSQNELIWCS